MENTDFENRKQLRETWYTIAAKNNWIAGAADPPFDAFQ